MEPRFDEGIKAIKSRPHIHRLQRYEDARRRREAQHDDPRNNAPRSSAESASRHRTVRPPAPSVSLAHLIAGTEPTPAKLTSRNSTRVAGDVARALVNHPPNVETPRPWRRAKARRVRPLLLKRAIQRARWTADVRRLRRPLCLDGMGAA